MPNRCGVRDALARPPCAGHRQGKDSAGSNPPTPPPPNHHPLRIRVWGLSKARALCDMAPPLRAVRTHASSVQATSLQAKLVEKWPQGLPDKCQRLVQDVKSGVMTTDEALQLATVYEEVPPLFPCPPQRWALQRAHAPSQRLSVSERRADTNRTRCDAHQITGSTEPPHKHDASSDATDRTMSARGTQGFQAKTRMSTWLRYRGCADMPLASGRETGSQ